MKTLTRREFFNNFRYDLIDQIDCNAAKKILSQLRPASESAPEAQWVSIGRMADFTPGISRKVQVGAIAITLQSLSDGFWAERPDGQRVALQTQQGGEVLVNVGAEWPNDRMLSHLTGNPIEQILQHEIEQQEKRNEQKER